MVFGAFVQEIIKYKASRPDYHKCFFNLLEKIFLKNSKAMVIVDSEKEEGELDRGLWSFKQQSFIPHDTITDCEESNLHNQPILISHRVQNYNQAEIMVLCDLYLTDRRQITEASKIYGSFSKVVCMFFEEPDIFTQDQQLQNIGNTRNFVQSQDMSWRVAV